MRQHCLALRLRPRRLFRPDGPPGRGRTACCALGRRRAANLPSCVARDVPLARYGTWGVGGPADLLAVVQTRDELQEVLSYAHAHSIRTAHVGRGSNMLFDDAGFRGIVIVNAIGGARVEPSGRVAAGAGHLIATLATRTARMGLTGLEFAAGIPGTVGGAVATNAGAHGSETCDVVASVLVACPPGRGPPGGAGGGGIRWVEVGVEDLRPSYRSTVLKDNAVWSGCVVAEARLQLRREAARGEAAERTAQWLQRRSATQPVSERTAGCVFRNPGDGAAPAGALIEAAGLKGMRVGGAVVSDKHANFIVNADGRATARDVIELRERVRSAVREAAGVDLVGETEYLLPEGDTMLQM
ncbi:unnamed protein product [Pedinophyceae sp. YPF-701]|nr:unnamed protein product [Pedinophyceae sp. YPF-701]